MDEGVNWPILKEKFVVEGWDPSKIAAHFQVKRMLVALEMNRDNWRQAREDYIKVVVQQQTEAVGLEGHITAADHLVGVGKKLAEDMKDPTQNYQILRSRAETYRTTVEALNISMRLARDVRGIRLGQPSAENTENKSNEVIYTVRVDRGAPAEEEQVG
jgi:hypothetical protein